MEKESFIKLLESADGSDEGFKQLMTAAQSYVSDIELATEFQVAVSTASRWRNGVARPHPRMRQVIYKYLRTKVS